MTKPIIKSEKVKKLKKLWIEHDRMERKILMLERQFTDKELYKLGAAAGSDK